MLATGAALSFPIVAVQHEITAPRHRSALCRDRRSGKCTSGQMISMACSCHRSRDGWIRINRHHYWGRLLICRPGNSPRSLAPTSSPRA